MQLVQSSHDNASDEINKIYFGKRDKVALTELPPWQDTPYNQNKWANCQCRVWQLCFE